MNTSTRTRRGLAAVATLGLLAVPFAANANDDATAAGPVAASGSGGVVSATLVKNLDGQQTEVALDQGFVDALGQLNVTPGTLGQAELNNGTLSFPVTGGNAGLFPQGEVRPYVIGTVFHENSGLSLSAGGTQVDIENLTIDPGASKIYGDVSVDGEPLANNVYVFFADGRTLEAPEVSGNTATLTGTEVKLTAGAAEALNGAFGIEDLSGGLLIGTATITLGIGG